MMKSLVKALRNIRRTYVGSKLHLESIQQELDVIRCRIDTPPQWVEDFQRDRGTKQYQDAFCELEPLVSICVGTFNRAKLLTERTLPSLLRQDYKRIEIIVVGDCCSDDTENRISSINDGRIRFINLSERGKYPENPNFRWMVAGTLPFNRALSLAQGTFITHLDDDDEHAPDRVSKLVTFLQKQKADLVWHPFTLEDVNGDWQFNEALDFRHGNVTTSSVMYHRWFCRIPWDLEAYRLREPGDWNRFRKFRYLDANLKRYPETLLKHFRERNQKRDNAANS